jgi:hypothetical protein
MAMHEILFPRFLQSLTGKALVGGVYGGGGSRNYKLMGYGADYLSNPRLMSSRERFLDILHNDKTIGHGTDANNVQGIACEQGSPGAHFTFTYAPILAAYNKATAIGDHEMSSLCANVLYAEVALCREFSLKGRVCMPGARFKDDAQPKTPGLQSQGLDAYRDMFVAMALGGSVPKKPDRFWNDPQSVCVKLARDTFYSPKLWDVVRALREPLPKLYLPINRRDIDGGGYLAWIDKTDSAVKAMGKDGCNWALARSFNWKIGEYKFGYDWEPMPEV